MAYFRKRGSKWSFTVDTGKKPDGSRNQKAVGGFATKKMAQLAASEIEKEVADGAYIHDQDTLFNNFAEEWIQIYSQDAKASSIRVRKHELSLLLKYFDKLQLREITKKAYQKVLLNLKADEYASNTIAGVHGTAKMLFKKAREFDLIKTDPTEFARPPRVQPTIEDLEKEDLPRYMEKEQLATFLHSAKAMGLGHDYAMFLVLSYSGMRAGELCALKWSDVDLKANTISITKTYYNPNNRVTDYALHTPKTKSSKRVLEVDPIVIEELERHQMEQSIFKMRFRDTYHDENFVFVNSTYPGYPNYIKSIEDRMARLLKLANLNQALTPHSLRHTHTSLLAEAGVGLEEIMERLGHSDDETTRRVYLHVTKEMKKKASQKFSELMKGLS